MDYCLDGEERFGWIFSLIYWMLIKMPPIAALHKFVLNDLSNISGKRILDIGTGVGDVPIMLSKSGRFKRIYAVDPSDAMLAIAKRRAKGKTNLFFVKGSSRHLPFDKKFGMIISVLSFHHWRMKAHSLRYISRFLGEKGEIRIYEFKNSGTGRRSIFSRHKITREKLSFAIEKAGLRIKEIREEGPIIRATIVRQR